VNETASANHLNRRAYNFSEYEARDRFFAEHKAFFEGHVYDFGCGEAPFRSFVEACGGRYIGIDWGSSQHDVAADIIADLNNTVPLPDACADTVMSISVLEHLHSPHRMLSEAHRVLRPGGRLVLQVPWMWRVHEEPHDYFRFTPFGLQHLLQQAGFKSVEVTPTNGVFGMLSLKLNYASRRLVRGPTPVRRLVTAALTPSWYISQRAGQMLDRFDRTPMKESSSYFAVATKG
jgi:SAM-dependent methyltransferase